MTDYQKFIDGKRKAVEPCGIEPAQINPTLYAPQQKIVAWALKMGRAAIFADCGLGKTFMQTEWARQIPGDVLVLAPLAVAQQTIAEAARLGVAMHYCRGADEVQPGITIANYEMLEHFDCTRFAGVVLDESSILKNFDGATRKLITESFAGTKYKLACTATPAPNDYTELGTHAEFLGVLTKYEMLATYFVHDGGDTSQWRLKGHAESDFWRWVCSWSVMVRKWSDIGFPEFDSPLPELRLHEWRVDAGKCGDFLFPMPASTLQERLSARRDTIEERVNQCATLCNGNSEQWLVWCALNTESEMLADRIEGAKEIVGSMKPEKKAELMDAFTRGEIRVLVTKPSIAGMGMNWQHCKNVCYVGLSDSFEEYYQSVRRVWRFGQKQPVDVHIITASIEGAVRENIRRKEADAARMAEEMVLHWKENGQLEKKETTMTTTKMESGENWTIINGDCVPTVAGMPDNSIGFTVFSPPFASLYTYSDKPEDMGNTSNDEEFARQFEFLVRELGRVLKPGRLAAIHCFDIPSMKARDGVIGLKDFSNQIRTTFERHGFIYHSRITIWKDPVTQMQRTKALGLLHKTIRKDSSMSRVGLPDYLIVMRKAGDNPDPIAHDAEDFTVGEWQKLASPVWFDIDPSETLNRDGAREERDERHICPLQLEVIRRALRLWSNPGDLVLSPFAGIGSEGYVSVMNGRKFIGVELKQSYFRQAVANLQHAEASIKTQELKLF